MPLLDQKDLDRFRVDYGNEIIEELEQLVEDSPSGDSKIIFTGHRGCGKSTLLTEFGRRCNNRYFVVFFSISDMIEMSDVNHINILFAIAVNLMAEAEKHQVEIPKSTKAAFYNWFATKTQIDSRNLGTEGSSEVNILETIKFKLKAEAVFREELKKEFKRDFRDLVARINEIAAIIYAIQNQEIIVIIDDLDKLDLSVAREIYIDNIKALFQLTILKDATAKLNLYIYKL